MQTAESGYAIERPATPGLKKKLLNWLRLTNEITVKVYHGYSHAGHIVIFGHVLLFGPLPRKKFRQNFWINFFALIRCFLVKPFPKARVQLRWEGKLFDTLSDTDGFFKLEWKSDRSVEFGWHPIQVEVVNETGNILKTGEGFLFAPHITQFGFISDIDDTFLISHSSNLRKRLFVLLRHNARSRQPFEGVVKHYQALARGCSKDDEPNPFFYVSSSEWNLYDLLLEFITVQALPRGIFLLNQLKRWYQIWKTGGTSHGTKFFRIVRILESFPNQKFILLGDSSQKDPYIYASIVEHFPNRIFAIYIRDIYRRTQSSAREIIKKVEASGVHCCFFAHSTEAFEHSKKIGLIEG